jgi:hypothetical protein
MQALLHLKFFHGWRFGARFFPCANAKGVPHLPNALPRPTSYTPTLMSLSICDGCSFASTVKD